MTRSAFLTSENEDFAIELFACLKGLDKDRRADIHLLNHIMIYAIYDPRIHTIQNACKEGNLQVVQYLAKHVVQRQSDVSFFGAYYGQLPILYWAKERNIPFSATTCAYAAWNGQSHVVQWLRQNNYPWDERTYGYAIQSGHWELAKWVHENGGDKWPHDFSQMLETGDL